MTPARLLLVFSVAFGLLGPAASCIYKYGSSPDSLAAHHGGTHWDHSLNGDDWTGVDATGKPWPCMSGARQSPLNLPGARYLEAHGSSLPRKFRTSWSYPPLVSNGTNIEVINNGHTIQVEWLSPFPADVKVAVPANPSNATRVTAVLGMADDDASSTVGAMPLQFHFHAMSEHLIAGKSYPLELHIVHRVTDLPGCAGGCFTVTGVLFQLTEGKDNRWLRDIWEAMPMREGTINYLPAGASICLDELLPPSNARDYVTYEGSLTTPPCSEGLLWHVMIEPQTISHAQWNMYRTAVGYKSCEARNSSSSSNSSASEDHAHHHHHHHHHHHRRSILEEVEEPVGNQNEYTCKIVAYGYNFRNPQPWNGRTLKVARTDGSGSIPAASAAPPSSSSKPRSTL